MSLHDSYARRTPFELVFRDRQRAEAFVVAVQEDSAGRGADPDDPVSFITMGAVGEFVRDLQGPDAPPEAIHRYGALAFHGFHFTRSDCPVYVLGAEAARHLVGASPGGRPSPPTPAGYLQLPQHLFWTDGGDAPESVDGLFWTTTAAGWLHSLLVTGVRADRPGLGVVVLPEAPLSDVSRWLEGSMWEGGPDFSSGLPGAELDALCSFHTAGEVLKLVARFFAFVVSETAVVESHDPREGEVGGPRPSSLPFQRVTMNA